MPVVIMRCQCGIYGRIRVNIVGCSGERRWIYIKGDGHGWALVLHFSTLVYYNNIGNYYILKYYGITPEIWFSFHSTDLWNVRAFWASNIWRKYHTLGIYIDSGPKELRRDGKKTPFFARNFSRKRHITHCVRR